MLDLGVGQALEKDVRAVAVKAAKAFESAGAVVTEVEGVLTRDGQTIRRYYYRVVYDYHPTAKDH